MLHIRLGTTLLLAAVSCLLTSAEKIITCEGNVQLLTCDHGVIRVQAASYGRTNRETCSQGQSASGVNSVSCSLPGSFPALSNRCNGKKVCEFSTSVLHTSDPCRGIIKYVNTTYTCLPAIRVLACEGSSAQLHCAPGQVISIYGADYGRRDTTTCIYRRPNNQITNIYCSQPTNKVAARCNGQNSCSIDAINSVFGDPCRGIYKYLEVAYVCEYPLIY